MKKFLLLFASAVMAFAASAQTTVDFGIYFTQGRASDTTPGTGPMLGIAGYTEMGTTTYKVSCVSSNGKDVYTIKNFLNGSDYSFTFEEKPNTLGTDLRLGNRAEVTPQGEYTFSPDYVIFKKDGKDSFRAKFDGWVGIQSTSRLSGDNKSLYLRRTLVLNNTMEQSTNGTTWTALPSSISNAAIVVAGIIPVGVYDDPSGIDDVIADENAPVEYYNLQGLRVSDPQPGQMVIRRQGSKVSKIVVR